MVKTFKRYTSMLLALLLVIAMLLTSACGKKPVVPDDSTPDNNVVDNDDSSDDTVDSTTDDMVDNTTDESADNTDEGMDDTDSTAEGDEPDDTNTGDVNDTTNGGEEDTTTSTTGNGTTKKTTKGDNDSTQKTTNKTTGKTTTKSGDKSSTKKTTSKTGNVSTSKTTTGKTTTKSGTKVTTTTKTTTTKKTTTTTTRYKPVVTTKGTQSINSLMARDAFVSAFEGFMAAATDYTFKADGSTKISSALTAYLYTIKSDASEYCLHLYCDKNDQVTTVNLTLPRKQYEYMFPVFSFYIYQIFGFPEVEVLDFIDRFESMPSLNDYKKESHGIYQINCFTPDEFYTFSVTSKGYEINNTSAMSTKLTDASCKHCMNNPDRILNSMALTRSATELGIRADMLDKALVSKGNQARLAKVMNRAKNGEDITVAFIGGSVTEGAYASDYKTKSYAGLTKAWWANTFPQSDVTFINAGIGGTSSLYGVHRVEQDVLSHDPDFVVIEFGVNDIVDEMQAEAYASLVRRVLSYKSQPAVMLLFVMNEGGNNAQADQVPIGLHYDLPMISYRDAVWPEVNTSSNIYGQYKWSDIAADWVHPTNKGHAIIAELLCSYLQKTYENLSSISTSVPALPSADRPYSFENAKFLNNSNTTPESLGSFSATSQNNASWKSSGNKPIVIKFTGKRVILPIPSDYASNLDVTIRIDGGKSFKMGAAMFKGGRYANFLVFDEDTVGEHTIEITCNSGTLYLGGLFVS